MEKMKLPLTAIRKTAREAGIEERPKTFISKYHCISNQR